MTHLRDRIFGDRDRLGWWTFPVFVMVGLTGAVLAGALAAVYFGQQVDALEDETRDAREAAASAAAEVASARDDAMAEIDEQVASVREALTREFPFEDVHANGVVAIRAFVGSPPPEAAAGDGEGTSPTVQDSPAPADAGGAPPEPRVGSGFAISAQDGTVFLATTYGVVADPDAPGGIVQRLEVVTPAGTFAGVVHSWDEGRDLAVVRAQVGEVTIPLWRSSAAPLSLGERVVVAGTTPTPNPVQIAGQVGFADVSVLVTDLPDLPFLQGAPLVDASGHVVGVYSSRYRPLGAEAGGRQSSIPVRLLCERMLQNCDALEAPAPDGD